MKRAVLIKIASYIQQYNQIFAIERVEDTIIKIVFENRDRLFFDMKKSNSIIFKKESFLKAKEYQAPFDIVLKKLFTKAKIEKVEVEEGNRILKIYIESSLKYRKESYLLQFEFTGKNTNVIILDEKNIVQEALRQININNSFREVKVGNRLLPLPPIEIKESFIEIEDIEKFLYNEYLKVEQKRLNNIKTQKIKSLNKKIEKLEASLKKIENSEILEIQSQKTINQANLLLANLDKIKIYNKSVELLNYDGKLEKIILPKNGKSPSHIANIFFEKAKKLKQKAKNSFLEIQNLESKIDFFKSLINIVKKANSLDEINIYFPKKQNRVKKDTKDSNIETFFYENHKIILGKNEKGNEKILKEAKKNDLWIHLKNRPSCHIIIKTDKQNLVKI